jgi:hypothetical protein
MADDRPDQLRKLEEQLDEDVKNLLAKTPDGKARRPLESVLSEPRQRIEPPSIASTMSEDQSLRSQGERILSDIEQTKARYAQQDAELQKINSRFTEIRIFGLKTRTASPKLPMWFAALVVGAFVAFLLYAATKAP